MLAKVIFPCVNWTFPVWSSCNASNPIVCEVVASAYFNGFLMLSTSTVPQIHSCTSTKKSATCTINMYTNLCVLLMTSLLITSPPPKSPGSDHSLGRLYLYLDRVTGRRALTLPPRPPCPTQRATSGGWCTTTDPPALSCWILWMEIWLEPQYWILLSNQIRFKDKVAVLVAILTGMFATGRFQNEV